MQSNDRISFIAQLIGGAGMIKLQRSGNFFKILVAAINDEATQIAHIFNHDDLHEALTKDSQGFFLFERFRASIHHGVKGIVSADDSAMLKKSTKLNAESISEESMNEPLRLSNKAEAQDSPSGGPSNVFHDETGKSC